MIEKHYLFPECYVIKIPKCDECNIELKQEPYVLSSNPVQYNYRCPKCNKEYHFYEKELEGEWKWRTI